MSLGDKRMAKSIEQAIIDYLEKAEKDIGWRSQSEICKAIYKEFENKYTKDTFKRIVIRKLNRNPKIMKNFNSPLYAIKHRRRPITKEDIEFIRTFFEMVDDPSKYYDPSLKEYGINQYPDIPLEKTRTFQDLKWILSKLWEDPRFEKVEKFSR